MDELSMFERRLAAGLAAWVGPRQAVDGQAVARAAKARATSTPRSQRLRGTTLPRPLAALRPAVLFILATAVLGALLVGGLFVGGFFDRQSVLQPTPGVPQTTAPQVTVPATSPTPTPSETASPPPATEPALIAFLRTRNDTGRMSLWSIRTDGSDARLVRDNFGTTSMAWTPDGRQLLAVRDYKVYLADVTADGIGPFIDTGFTTQGDTACDAKAGPRVPPVPCQDSAFSFAPDGDRVVFIQRCTGGRGCWFLTILNVRTGERTELSETLGDAADQIATPVWSPIDDTIAYVLDNRPISADIRLIDADGSNPRHIELGDLSVVSIAWSPDGTTLALSAVREGDDVGLWDIHTIRTDGSDLRQLTDDGVSAHPAWTSDGRIRYRLVPDSFGFQSTAFWQMDADGSSQSLLIDLGPGLAAIEPAGKVSNLWAPGEPLGGYTYWWQPGP